jgi:hypothetical protein
MRRISLISAALAVALLGGLFALQASGAGAQEPTHEVFVFSDIPVQPNGLGQGSVPVGTDDGVLGADCQGNSPLGGTPQLPAQVISELGATEIAVRIFNNVGARVSGPVELNCSLDVDTTEPTAVNQLKAKLKSA